MNVRSVMANIAILVFASNALANDGTIDKSYGNWFDGQSVIPFPTMPSGNDFLVDIVALKDDSIILVGRPPCFNCIGLAKLTSTGQVDTSFGNYGFVIFNSGVQTIIPKAATMDSFGKIVVAGTYQPPAPQLQGIFLARFNIDGTPANFSFNDNFVTFQIQEDGTPLTVDASDVAPLSGGDLVVVGTATYSTSPFSDAIAIAVSLYGELDQNFGTQSGHQMYYRTNKNVKGYAVSFRNDKIVIAGTVDNGTGHGQDMFVLRTNTSGGQDSSFGNLNPQYPPLSYIGYSDIAVDIASPTYVNDVPYDVVIGSDNSVYVAGSSVLGPGRVCGAIAKLNSSGDLVSSFGSNGTGIYCHTGQNYSQSYKRILQKSDGSIVTFGSRQAAQQTGYTDFVINQYTSDGKIDLNFGFGGEVAVHVLSGSKDNAYTTNTPVSIALTGKHLYVGGFGYGNDTVDIQIVALINDLIFKDGFQ